MGQGDQAIGGEGGVIWGDRQGAVCSTHYTREF